LKDRIGCEAEYSGHCVHPIIIIIIIIVQTTTVPRNHHRHHHATMIAIETSVKPKCQQRQHYYRDMPSTGMT
jgi:hypothetical protein